MRDFFREADFAARYEGELLPFLKERKKELHFAGFDGKMLYGCRYDAPDPRGSLLILHGLNESTEKYRELIGYFLKDGLSVFIYDQRGHGRSPRAVPAGLIHTDGFSELVADARCAVGELQKMPGPYYLFCHSMGGAVGALLLEEGSPFQKAVLSSPMIAPFRYPSVPPGLVRTFCRGMCLLGQGKRRVFVQKSPNGAEKPEIFEEGHMLSPARFAAYAAVKRTLDTYQTGALSYRFAAEAIGVTKRILKKGGPEGVSIPVRIYGAELDTLVQRPPQEAFAARLPRGEFILVSGSKHEIYGANDGILHPYLCSVLDFLR